MSTYDTSEAASPIVQGWKVEYRPHRLNLSGSDDSTGAIVTMVDPEVVGVIEFEQSGNEEIIPAVPADEAT